MDRYDPYTDKFLRDTQYDIPSMNLAEVGMDLISRKQAITQLSHNKNKGDEEWKLAVENDIQTIWKLPPAQPEPKRGKWESQSGGGYCCSKCGRYAMDKADGRIVMISVKSKFCPNCGAKMEVTT